MKILLYLLVVLPIFAFSSEKPKVFPEALLEFAKKHNCQALTDKGFIEGKIHDSQELVSQIFWCRLPKESNEPPFTDKALLIKTSGEGKKCPEKIEGQNLLETFSIQPGHNPSGSKFSTGVKVNDPYPLSRFYEYGNRDKKGPQNLKTKHNLIYSSGSVGAYYYCHDGKWLVHEAD